MVWKLLLSSFEFWIREKVFKGHIFTICITFSTNVDMYNKELYIYIYILKQRNADLYKFYGKNGIWKVEDIIYKIIQILIFNYSYT